MNSQQNTKRILIFLALVIGASWAVALLIYTSSLMENDPNTAMSLANYIIITLPALAAILTRLVTKEGWKDLSGCGRTSARRLAFLPGRLAAAAPGGRRGRGGLLPALPADL